MSLTRGDAALAFSGSYDPADVVFLLKSVREAEIGLAAGTPLEKEALLQSGERHYSEMVARETPPDDAYTRIFDDALERHQDRMGREVAELALALNTCINGPITLASLVRAGVPLGVLLTRSLRTLGRDVAHFGVSIIRDRGIDMVAIDAILARRPPSGLVFVDGWTGKGAIAGELEMDLRRRAPRLAPRLVVLADPCGRAWLSAGFDDWLIPSGILGGTVSGLVSRSVLNDKVVKAGDFHATVMQESLRGADVSGRFADVVHRRALGHLGSATPANTPADARAAVRAAAAAVVDGMARLYGIDDRNRIKPGIAEATRAVLRRAPERVLVRREDDPDLAGIVHLARERGIEIIVSPDLLGPYRAMTLIRDVRDRA